MSIDARVKKQMVLIVDDSEINRSILSDMLDKEYNIIEAETGLEAIVQIKKHESELSLVLLDIVMPMMDGFEVLATMNKGGWISDIPVIMISAEASLTYMDHAYDLGATDYINRPFDGRIVRRRVKNTIMLYAKQKMLQNMITEQVFEKEKNNNLMIEILSNIVEFRNGESGLHVLHIRTITELLLNCLLQSTDKYPLTHSQVVIISNASTLHDIGKISIPEEILNKPGKLTFEEFEIMKTHAAVGSDMLKNITMRQDEKLIKTAYKICRWHHERYDGKGYPDGLKGEEIPIEAQVVALADVYDALISVRVYKPSFSHEKALEMILNGECGAFNPILLQCLLDISGHIEKELHIHSVGGTEKKEMYEITAEIIARGDVSASDRTLKLLEQERIKYQFFASMSEEVQFEYNALTDMVLFSEWGAAYLGISELIINPMEENGELEQVIQKDNLKNIYQLLHSSTYREPIISGTYCLKVGGKDRWCKLVARSLWSDEEMPTYMGSIGKFTDIHEDYRKMTTLKNN